MLQCYADTLFNVLCSNATTTGGRECVYVHAQNLAKNREMSKRTKWTAAVWGAGFRCVSARTLSEQKQKHRYLQRARAIWRTPVGTVETALQSYGVTLLQRSRATL